MAEAPVDTGFPATKTVRLESFRSSVTFKGDSFEDRRAEGMAAIDSTGFTRRMTVQVLLGERGQGGMAGPALPLGLPHGLRHVPPTPIGFPGGGPDASDR